MLTFTEHVVPVQGLQHIESSNNSYNCSKSKLGPENYISHVIINVFSCLCHNSSAESKIHLKSDPYQHQHNTLPFTHTPLLLRTAIKLPSLTVEILGILTLDYKHD